MLNRTTGKPKYIAPTPPYSGEYEVDYAITQVEKYFTTILMVADLIVEI